MYFGLLWNALLSHNLISKGHHKQNSKHQKNISPIMNLRMKESNASFMYTLFFDKSGLTMTVGREHKSASEISRNCKKNILMRGIRPGLGWVKFATVKRIQKGWFKHIFLQNMDFTEVTLRSPKDVINRGCSVCNILTRRYQEVDTKSSNADE